MDEAEKKSGRGVWLAGYAVCVAGFALAVAAFYPGYMSPDSTSQLMQARAWDFTDWHPPLMAALWGLVDRVFPGPAGMLVLLSEDLAAGTVSLGSGDLVLVAAVGANVHYGAQLIRL